MLKVKSQKSHHLQALQPDVALLQLMLELLHFVVKPRVHCFTKAPSIEVRDERGMHSIICATCAAFTPPLTYIPTHMCTHELLRRTMMPIALSADPAPSSNAPRLLGTPSQPCNNSSHGTINMTEQHHNRRGGWQSGKIATAVPSHSRHKQQHTTRLGWT